MTDTTPGRFTTPEIYSDLPLLEEGFEDEEAFFRFREYSTTFARMLAAKRTRTPMVLGISGKWGSGKTTLLRLIRRKLDSSQHLRDNLSKVEFVGAEEEQKEALAEFRPCRTVWFNAWKYADEDSLLAALIRAILEAMARGGMKGKLKAWAAEKNQDRYDVVATFLSAFSFKFGAVDFGIDIEKYKKDAPFKAHTAFFDHFNAALEQLLALWVHGSFTTETLNPDNGILAIFIDDLDRCLPAKTMQVLEAVKLFLDKRGVAFVIGADEDVIRRAVTAHYEKEKIEGEDAEKYLEKIFQVRFGLPPLRSTDVGNYMRQPAGLDLRPEQQNNIGPIVAGTETNPRRIKTTLNNLQLNWAILKNSGQATDDLRDDFTLWLLIEMVAGNFATQTRNIEDLDLRHKFVTEALQWARNVERADWLEKNAALAGQYRAYEGNQRLRRILKEGTFSPRVTAAQLDQFVYWSASVPEAGIKVSEGIDGVALDTSPGLALSWPTTDKAFGTIRYGDIEFVEIPAGKFLMGSRDDDSDAYDAEKPQHTVEITRPYLIGRYPVTNAQYRLFAEAERTGWKTAAPDDHPAVNVSWDDAAAFCKWWTAQHKAELSPDIEIRLPTEAEWEKAARGEYGNEYPWGNEWDAKKCNTREGGPGTITPVGAYSEAGGDSPYGVADMAGNVWEWCADWFDEKEYSRRKDKEMKDPLGPAKGSWHSLRGGAWGLNRRTARCAARNRGGPVYRNDIIGFRVVAASPVSRS